MNTVIPSPEEIKALHKRYAPSDLVFDLVYTHCAIVSEIALWCADNLPEASIDRELLVAACLLHDIGTYALYSENGHISNMHTYRQHAVFGAALVTEEKFDPRLADMIRTHVQLGLSKQEIIDLKIAVPVSDYQPESLEGRLVCYADRFHSKEPRFNSYETLNAKLYMESPKQGMKFKDWSEEFGIPDIDSLAHKYNHPIR